MVFKIIMLATLYLKRGRGSPHPITETLEGRLWTHNFLPESQSDNKDLCIYKSVVTRCRGYTGACVGLPNPIIWQSIYGIKLQKVQESAGSAVGDISIHKGDQAAIQGVTGQTKLIVYNVFDG